MPPAPARAFASDNAAGAHPKVVEAVLAANEGHALAYGSDEWTGRAEAGFRDYINRFPDASQMADAHYWLGEALLGQQKHHEAAEVFDVCWDGEHLRYSCHWPSTGRFVKNSLRRIEVDEVALTYTYTAQDTLKRKKID